MKSLSHLVKQAGMFDTSRKTTRKKRPKCYGAEDLGEGLIGDVCRFLDEELRTIEGRDLKHILIFGLTNSPAIGELHYFGKSRHPTIWPQEPDEIRVYGLHQCEPGEIEQIFPFPTFPAVERMSQSRKDGERGKVVLLYGGKNPWAFDITKIHPKFRYNLPSPVTLSVGLITINEDGISIDAASLGHGLLNLGNVAEYPFTDPRAG